MKKYILIGSVLFIILVLSYFADAQEALKSIVKKHDSENILFIMDSSYSMSDEIDGKEKIDIAKETLSEALKKISPDIKTGLRVYGHKNGILGFNACRASELVTPIGINNKSFIERQVNKLSPTGWTPITYSLKQAVNFDLARVQGAKRILLLSDGEETCDESPCEYVLNLIKTRPDIKIDVIGFALNNEEAVDQLKCTALVTKGRFYQAHGKGDLQKALSEILDSKKEVHGLIVQ